MAAQPFELLAFMGRLTAGRPRRTALALGEDLDRPPVFGRRYPEVLAEKSREVVRLGEPERIGQRVDGLAVRRQPPEGGFHAQRVQVKRGRHRPCVP